MTLELDSDRVDTVRRQADTWADALIDLGPRNSMLYYKPTQSTTLDLTDAEPPALRSLLSRKKTGLGMLFPDPARYKDASARARTLRRRLIQLDEEQGLEAGHLARGLLRVEIPKIRGASAIPALRAPILLQPIQLQTRTPSDRDFVLQLNEDLEVNPVLLYALHRQYGVNIVPEQFSEKLNGMLEEYTESTEQLEAIADAIAEVCERSNLTTSLEQQLIVGIFSYEKLPMVYDLRNSPDLLAQHDIIAAAAHYEPAREALHTAARSTDPPTPDDVDPANEFLVHDADSSQYRAIQLVLAGQNLVIEGPPGTGKSQTITNIIAGMAAQGRSVLFVAEKRAAIEAVTDALAKVDLRHLVLDLHRKVINRRDLAQQLHDSLERNFQELPARLGDLNVRLVKTRRTVNLHPARLHLSRDPWGVTAYQVQAELLELAPWSCNFTFAREHLRALHSNTYVAMLDDLKTFLDKGGLAIRRGKSAWARSQVRTVEDVQDALSRLEHVTTGSFVSIQAALQALVGQHDLQGPDDLAGWEDLLALLRNVGKTVELFGQDIFTEVLDNLYLATGRRRWRSQQQGNLQFRERRQVLRKGRTMYRSRLSRRDLHNELASAIQLRDEWRRLAGSDSQPVSVQGLDVAMSQYERARHSLAGIAALAGLEDIERQHPEDIEATLNRLRMEQDALFRMPELKELTERLEERGLGDFLNELDRRDANAEEAEALFRCTWLNSLWREFLIEDPHLRNFVGHAHSRTVDEYRRADTSHVKRGAQRVRREVAVNLRRVLDSHDDQEDTVRDQELRKRRLLPPRKLVDKAPDVLLSLFPCWAMSPLVVSRILPNRRLFDLVIFDEASQILPHDAVASIMRGRQLVIAGDDRQLPPDLAFQRRLTEADPVEDDDEDAAGDPDLYESVLQQLKGLVPSRNVVPLRWHYRSRDERLIAFSNSEIYRDSLVTFPGTREESPIRLDVVDGVAAPGQDGSSPQEVEHVVQLVLDHASSNPSESLGVIAMGTKHADRIEKALTEARRSRPELDPFFSDDQGPNRRFFIKSLEAVQGDERDAIILSIGYAKTAPGRPMALKFGPLTHAGGERRLNVAVTRSRRRMTVVSSFSHLDLNASETQQAKNRGPELLRRFLEFASRGGDLKRSSHQGAEGALDGFERNVLKALEAARLPVKSQWGVSAHCIDFALGHPEHSGRMVLAMETDGERYSCSASARDRDRLRQEHLERLDWQFYRLWSTEWFKDPDAELQRLVERWKQAITEIEQRRKPVEGSKAERRLEPIAQPSRGPRPNIPKKSKIQEHTDGELILICQWLLRDELPLPRDRRIEQAMAELGFQKRGRVILERLNWAFNQVEQINERGT